jgi:uncharacterized protein (DUF2267 family)
MAKQKFETSDATTSRQISRSKNHVSLFQKTLQKSEVWVAEMHTELEWMSADDVYHLLRATLQALRDQLSLSEAAHFSAQLPLLLRGTFYESWDPMGKAQANSKREFLELVRQKMGPQGQLNFDLELGVSVTLRTLSKHISPGEVQDVLSAFEPSLKEFFYKSESQQLES